MYVKLLANAVHIHSVYLNYLFFWDLFTTRFVKSFLLVDSASQSVGYNVRTDAPVNLTGVQIRRVLSPWLEPCRQTLVDTAWLPSNCLLVDTHTSAQHSSALISTIATFLAVSATTQRIHLHRQQQQRNRQCRSSYGREACYRRRREKSTHLRRKNKKVRQFNIASLGTTTRMSRAGERGDRRYTEERRRTASQFQATHRRRLVYFRPDRHLVCGYHETLQSDGYGRNTFESYRNWSSYPRMEEADRNDRHYRSPETRSRQRLLVLPTGRPSEPRRFVVVVVLVVLLLSSPLV